MTKPRGLLQRIEQLERFLKAETDADILRWGASLTEAELQEFAARDSSSEGEDVDAELRWKSPRDMTTAELLRVIKPHFEKWRQ